MRPTRSVYHDGKSATNFGRQGHSPIDECGAIARRHDDHDRLSSVYSNNNLLEQMKVCYSWFLHYLLYKTTLEKVTAHYADIVWANDIAINSTCLEILTLSLLWKLEAR